MKRIEKIFASLFLLSVTILLSGCSLLSPVQSNAGNQYVINTVPCVTTKPRSQAALLVMPMTASPIYNTTQMAYSTDPYQISYFAKNSWANTPPQMLQNLIVQTLQNTHHFRTVDAPPTIAQYDYALNTQLLELKQDFIGTQSCVRLKIRAQIINMSTNRVIATKEFTYIQPTVQNTPYGGVIAANEAACMILRELARFCTQII
jgi:cholesterol transport system auxiliary component